MRYGKIRIEDGFFVFTRHMMLNSLPCKDILWAYMRREGADKTSEKQLIINYLVIITRRQKRYKFDMTEQEVQDCLRLLKVLNPDLAVGFPKGSRLPLQNLPNTRDLGALMTEDGLHILPRKLLRSGEIYHASIADTRILSEEYNVKTVIDFRSAAEVKKKPDDIMAGVEYYHIPIRDEESNGNSFFERVMSCYGEGERYIQERYRSLITDEYSLKQYARFLDVLLHVKNGAVVFHSTTGEDRTGVGTALLLFALGVPKETIRRDYMRSNPCLEEELKYMRRLYRADRPENSRKLADLKAFYQVKESYINTVFDVIEKENGGIAMIHILVIDDDKILNKTMCTYLNDCGFKTKGVFSANEAYDELYGSLYDLIISDIMLPGIDGFELADTIRGINKQIPILFVSAKDDLSSKQKGFRLGIDDYMVKPIELAELEMRVKALLRRANIEMERKLTVGNLVLDADGMTAEINGEEIAVTMREFNILYKLLSYPKKTFSRAQLMDEFWGLDSQAGLRAVDVYITKLREKFADCDGFEIKTVRGLGYKAVLL